MHCAGCVKTIEEVARTLPGVAEARVNFATEQASLDIDPDRFRAAALQQALLDHGYRVVPRRVVYRVPGLDASGIATLEDRLRALPGVLAASANAVQSTVAADLLSQVDLGAFLRAQGLSPEPEEVQASDSESRDLALRAGVAVVLAAGVMALSMTGRGSHLLWLLLALPVQFWAGWPFHVGLYRSIRHLNPDMNTLISLATNAAFFASPFLEMPFYDTSTSIIAIVLVGRLLELRARRGTRRAVEALLELAPRTDVNPGDERTVKPGERFPADGVVLEGAGAADESMVTGESLPVEKHSGDRVIGGTLNRTGALRVRFDRTGEDTVLSQIVKMVRQAQGSKPPAQRLADLWASRFVPIVLLVALSTLAFWLWRSPGTALVRTISVLVVACPCAFGLATPAAIVVGAGRAARRGILFKDAEALEGLGTLGRIVFDKTGTLTQGQPAVKEVLPAPGFNRDEVLRAAGAAERASEHPIGRAIAAAAPPGPTAESFEARPGLGALARLEGRDVAIGNRAFFSILDIDLSPLRDAAAAATSRGETAVLVGIDGRLAGMISVADPPRAEAADVVQALRARGLELSMLTGDDASTARAMAERLGIAEVKAEVMPPDKASAVAQAQKTRRVGMVGDGINDAPALAQADVGIAVSRGTDVALEAADVVLMKNDLHRLVWAIDLSRAVRRVIHLNFAWAFGYNLLLIPLAAGVLSRWGLGLDPRLAAIAMAMSSITVLLNSLRLRRA